MHEIFKIAISGSSKLNILPILLMILCVGCSDERKHTNSNPPENMVLFPAGSYRMGEDSAYSLSNQKPIHEVHLNAYFIDETEVTVADFLEFIRDDGYKNQEFWTKDGWQYLQKLRQKSAAVTPASLNKTGRNKPRQPMSGMTWYEADAYARWAGKRLPTEAEWERAARGLDGRLYPWGNEMDMSRLHNIMPAAYRVGPVGDYPAGASPDGLLDMAGSLWEWVSDWYDESYYVYSQRENPAGPVKGTEKGLRGGAWGPNRLQWKSTYRYSEKPDVRRADIGFRCVRDAR